MPVGNVAYESDHPDDFAFASAVGSEGARFPNIVSLGGVLRYERISNLNDFALQRAVEGILYATRNQARKNVRCNLP